MTRDSNILHGPVFGEQVKITSFQKVHSAIKVVCVFFISIIGLLALETPAISQTIGEDCSNPILIGEQTALPFMDSGTTSGRINDIDPETGDSCPPTNNNEDQFLDGSGSGPDVTYLFSPSAEAKIRIEADPESGYDLALYVLSECGATPNSDGTCLFGDDGSNTEDLEFIVQPGTEYIIVIDGFGSSASGTYTLLVEELPLPTRTSTPTPTSTPDATATATPDPFPLNPIRLITLLEMIQSTPLTVNELVQRSITWYNPEPQ